MGSAAAVIPSKADRDARLRRQIEYCLTSPFYRDRFEEAGVDPGTIATVNDLQTLPIFVTPDTHRVAQEDSLESSGHPFSTFLCADPAEIVAVSSTSGTTGTPTFYPFTARDVEITDLLWQRALRFVGVRPGDRVVQGFGLSMYLAGLPVVRALERMGATPIPVGAEAGSAKLLRMIATVRPRVLACTPSYAEHLIERCEEIVGRPASDLGIEIIVCAGEPGAGLPEVRAKLENGWGARVFDLLGGAHGIMMASAPTDEYHGMYVLGDDFSVSTQLVDPVSKEPVDDVDGAVGERVKTSLEWGGAPPLRYSVGDVYQVFTASAPEGPAGKRIKVLGRVDDLLIVKGVKIYPAAVKDLVNGFVPEVTGEVRIVLDGPPPRVAPPLRLRVEAAGSPDPEVATALVARLTAAMHDRLTVRPTIELVPAGTLPRTTHKQQLLEIQTNDRRDDG
jgi:phenylacetate-CoA ligase